MSIADTRQKLPLRAFTALLVIAFALLLGACGGGSKPFAKSEGTPGPDGKSVPPIALAEVTGLPAEKLQPFRDALSISAGKRDMAIVEGAFDSGGFTLRGSFQIIPDPAAVRLAYSWTLTDQAGTVLHTISAEEIAPGTPGPDPWLLITPAVLQRAAAYTAESLSSRLSQLGYATEVGGLPPPLDSFAEAGPDADKDIDYETVNGPVRPPPVVAVSQPAQEYVPEQVEATSAEPVKKGTARREIKSVAVLAVTGAPGGGNDDLTGAMRQTLEDAGWPVLTKPRSDALTIAGEVKVSPKKGKKQTVALAWTVKSPDGRKLGTINQTNEVPAGSLEDGWGETALFAAQAAASGIYDLVKKFR